MYQRLIQPDGISEDIWLIELYSARNYKLTNEVDRIIANKDPTFRKYLAESAKVDSRGQRSGDGFWYMRQKRNEYWRGVTSKRNIWLADPTLFTTCKLADGGVTVPK